MDLQEFKNASEQVVVAQGRIDDLLAREQAAGEALRAKLAELEALRAEHAQLKERRQEAQAGARQAYEHIAWLLKQAGVSTFQEPEHTPAELAMAETVARQAVAELPLNPLLSVPEDAQ